MGQRKPVESITAESELIKDTNRRTKSLKVLRTGKPARRIFTVSSIPEYLSWLRTTSGLKTLGFYKQSVDGYDMDMKADRIQSQYSRCPEQWRYLFHVGFYAANEERVGNTQGGHKSMKRILKENVLIINKSIVLL